MKTRHIVIQKIKGREAGKITWNQTESETIKDHTILFTGSPDDCTEICEEYFFLYVFGALNFDEKFNNYSDKFSDLAKLMGLDLTKYTDFKRLEKSVIRYRNMDKIIEFSVN